MIRNLTLACAFTLALFSSAPLLNRADVVNLSPRLRPGQLISYRIDYTSDTQTQTRSSVVTPQAPENPHIEFRVLLHLEVLSVEPQGPRALIHARAHLQVLAPITPAANTRSSAQPTPPAASPLQSPDSANPAKSVAFTLQPDGHVDQLQGLDALDAAQRTAWQEWAARFAATGLFPANGVKPAEKWKSEQPEQSPSPIAKLTWQRQTTYIDNEPCRPFVMTPQRDTVESDQPASSCAVLVTVATLKQNSSPKDSTPEDFRLHQLRTQGIARGANKTVLYISLETGLLVRATEDASQAMDVTVAKSDGTNSVHYDVTAKSRCEVLLLVENSLPSH
ncbi:MAG TPA: hypothetical protein VGI16_08480 [Candidatus Acidoferrum sp.]|jgi:hypothetical protein